MELNFQIALESDCDTLVELVGEYHEFERIPFDKSEIRRALKDLLRDRTLGRAWLIRDGTVAVGYLVLCFGFSLEFLGRDAFIDEFFIRSSHRGRGWGRKAMQHVEEDARALGVQAIHLEESGRGSAARPLYEKMGYKKRDYALMTKRIGGNNPESAN